MTQQKSKKRMAERRARRRRQSQVRLMVGVSVIAVMAVGAIVLLTFLPDNTAEPVGGYEGLPQVIDRSGALSIVIGEPDAPVTLTEYTDFSCSHCKTVSTTIIPELIDEYVRDGRLRIVYKPLSFVYPAYSEPAAWAAICAAEQDQGWQMMDGIWNLESPALYSIENFVGIAGDIGLDVGTFRQCFNLTGTAEAAQSVVDEALAMGITSTPTLLVNGQPLDFLAGEGYAEALRRRIDAALGS